MIQLSWRDIFELSRLPMLSTPCIPCFEVRVGFSFGVFAFLAGLQMPPLPCRQVVAPVLHCPPVLYSLSLLQYLCYCYTRKWSFIMYSPGLTGTRLCRIGVAKRHNSGESPPKLLLRKSNLLPEVEFELVIHKVVHSEVEWTVLLPILWVCHKFWKSLESAPCSN